MNNKVTVQENKDGQVVNVNTNNPDYGYVRVGQTISRFNSDGWLSTETRSFLLKGKLNELQNSGLSAGFEMPGKLVRQESLEPFSDYSQPKVAGESGVVCKVDGQPIYSRVVYDRSGTMEDTLIAHDNKEEIIAAIAGNNVKPMINPADISEAFETEATDSKVDNSLNEEVEVEEVIDEIEEIEEDLDTDFVL